jgi:S-DNA-T family DNA segregation ATPase FtsK/SpoIIIE
MTPTTVTSRAMRAVGRETWWWLAGAAGLVARHPVRWTGWAGLVSLAVVQGYWLALTVGTGPVLVLALWCRIGAVSFARWIGMPAWRRRTRRQVAGIWPDAMRAVGLTRPNHQLSSQAVPTAERVVVPVLLSLRWHQGLLIARPRLLLGQTVEDWHAAGERLRAAVGAHGCRIVADTTRTGCCIEWRFGDPLAQPFDAIIPEPSTPPGALRSLSMGRSEDGGPWLLNLRVSTLGAGASGSGKASLIWSLLFALAPAIRAGLVEVHGIDLKGGMELAMGRAMFTRYADQGNSAVALLEETVAELRARTLAMAGTTRILDQPSSTMPLVVVVVDELAALVAYSPDRDLTKRADAALRILLSQGRAVGFYVWGFLQDPRKDTVAMRHLFGQVVGLRLREREETTMVLGDGTTTAGAACHHIPRTLPGVGYVIGDDGRPVRVRAGNVTDTMIKTAAARFPAPRQHPVDLTEPGRSTRSRVGRGSESRTSADRSEA